MSEEKISDFDQMQIEIGKLLKQLTEAQLQTAVAKNELAEAQYRNIVLQTFMKYKLDPNVDAIAGDGKIVRGGALSQNPEGK